MRKLTFCLALILLPLWVHAQTTVAREHDPAESDRGNSWNKVPLPPNNCCARPGYGYQFMDYYPFTPSGFYPGALYDTRPYYPGGWLSERWYAQENRPGIGEKMRSGPIFGTNSVWPPQRNFGAGTGQFSGNRIWSFILVPK